MGKYTHNHPLRKVEIWNDTVEFPLRRWWLPGRSPRILKGLFFPAPWLPPVCVSRVHHAEEETWTELNWSLLHHKLAKNRKHNEQNEPNSTGVIILVLNLSERRVIFFFQAMLVPEIYHTLAATHHVHQWNETISTGLSSWNVDEAHASWASQLSLVLCFDAISGNTITLHAMKRTPKNAATCNRPHFKKVVPVMMSGFADVFCPFLDVRKSHSMATVNQRPPKCRHQPLFTTRIWITCHENSKNISWKPNRDSCDLFHIHTCVHLIDQTVRLSGIRKCRSRHVTQLQLAWKDQPIYLPFTVFTQTSRFLQDILIQKLQDWQNTPRIKLPCKPGS